MDIELVMSLNELMTPTADWHFNY